MSLWKNENRKYFNCHFMKHSIHFFYDGIKACCTNVDGLVFEKDYSGETINWDKFYQKRLKIFKETNGIFSKQKYPDCCKNCCDLNNAFSTEKTKNFKNIIDKVYFHNHMECNAKCIYCTYNQYQRNHKYRVLPIVKQMIEKEILSKQAQIYMSGGEITISPDFESLMNILSDYVNTKIEILTSGIKYCESIADSFKSNKCYLIISLDSAESEVYKAIKQVDCFDKVIDNIKKYISISDNAKENILMKYIIVDGINDNEKQIGKFLDLCHSLGIKNVRLDFDYNKYKYGDGSVVPMHYFDLFDLFNKKASELGLIVNEYVQITETLKYSKEQAGI